LYLIILVVVMVYEWKVHNRAVGELGSYDQSMMIVYSVLVVHTVFLLLMDPYSQRNLIFPVAMLLFILFGAEERTYLLLFGVVQMEYISKIGHEYDSKGNTIFAGRNCRRFALLLLWNQPFWIHQMLEATYEMGDIILIVPGIFNVSEFTTLSGMLFAIHKFGYHVLMIVFLIRMASPEAPMSEEPQVQVYTNRLHTWYFVLSYFFCSVFLYEIGFIVFPMQISFVFTTLNFVIIGFYGSAMVGLYIGSYALKCRPNSKGEVFAKRK